MSYIISLIILTASYTTLTGCADTMALWSHFPSRGFVSNEALKRARFWSVTINNKATHEALMLSLQQYILWKWNTDNNSMQIPILVRHQQVHMVKQMNFKCQINELPIWDLQHYNNNNIILANHHCKVKQKDAAC